jgi:hypothetical protein
MGALNRRAVRWSLGPLHRPDFGHVGDEVTQQILDAVA